jgi:hypothetical protein
MNEKELSIRIVQLGIAAQRRQLDKYTQANGDATVRTAGNAAIATSLEFLGKHGVVADVQPCFGADGPGFAYRINPELVQELSTDQAITRKVQALFSGSTSETSSTLAELLSDCERVTINSVYRDDLLTSIRELQICFDNACYIACLALSGKILEICLKQLMLDSGIAFDDGWMIGQLLKKLRDANCPKYLDPSLGNLGNIINHSRIPAVHAKEKIPVPSKEQAVMVIHAVVDLARRTIIAP